MALYNGIAATLVFQFDAALNSGTPTADGATLTPELLIYKGNMPGPTVPVPDTDLLIRLPVKGRQPAPVDVIGNYAIYHVVSVQDIKALASGTASFFRLNSKNPYNGTTNGLPGGPFKPNPIMQGSISLPNGNGPLIMKTLNVLTGIFIRATDLQIRTIITS